MGLIKAITSATSSTFGDQFKEFVKCPEIDKNVLIQISSYYIMVYH